MKIPKSLATYQKKAAELQKEVQTLAKSSVIKDLFTEFFASAPSVKAVRWLQYTPHFNDGDVCEFSVHEPEVQLNNQPEDEDDDWHDTYSLVSDYNGKTPLMKQKSPEFLAISELAGIIQSDLMEDLLLAAFDDGYEITITSDGDIEVEEYSHD